MKTHHTDNSHGTYQSYVLGFILSIVLTLASYFAVTTHSFSVSATYIIISLLALLQLFVQLVFFLHISSEEKPRWNLTSFAFTVLVTVILAGGSLWVMYNMNINMMPSMA